MADLTDKQLAKRDTGDHDLLIRVDTKLDILTATVKDYTNDTSGKIKDLQVEKLNVCDSYPVLYKEAIEKAIADHEERIRVNTGRVIKIMAYGSAILIFIGILEPFLLAYFKVKI